MSHSDPAKKIATDDIVRLDPLEPEFGDGDGDGDDSYYDNNARQIEIRAGAVQIRVCGDSVPETIELLRQANTVAISLLAHQHDLEHRTHERG